jgi:hypothetical protein
VTIFKFALLSILSAAYALPACAGGINPDRAASGYTYFNRSGASLAIHDQELRECLSISLPLKPPHSVGLGVAGGVIGSVVNQIGDGIATDYFLQGNVEKCMMVRGWRVVRVPDAEGSAIAQLSRAEIGTALADWVGMATPHGQVVRYFGDAGAMTRASAFGIARQKSLSIAAADLRNVPIDEHFEPLVATDATMRAANKAELKPLKPDQVGQVDPASAILIVELRGRRADGWKALYFGRISDDLQQFTRDGLSTAPDTTWFRTPLPKDAFRGSEEKGSTVGVYVVRPGLWAVTSAPLASMCLMAPAFVVKAGEVLFVGSFDLDDLLATDVGLQGVRSTMPPGSLLAEKVRAAPWVNGLSWQCRGLMIGGYEIVGAPFLDSFHWRPQLALASTTP